MPVIPGGGASPYDTVTMVMNAARMRLNDQLNSLFPYSGKILDETQAGTQQACNNGWRRFQSRLSGLGVERFKGEVIIPAIPPVTSQDPSAIQSISWTQFFDGTNYQTQPVLPFDLTIPLWMSCRPANQNFPWPDADRPNMRNMTDGLTLGYKLALGNPYQWEWRDEKINMPGFPGITVDLRIGYRKYFNDFADGDVRWFAQPVPIIRCQDPLAWWFATEFAAARAADGDAAEQMLTVAASCKEEAEEATQIYANDTIMKNQRTNFRRSPYGRAGRSRGGYGYGGFGG